MLRQISNYTFRIDTANILSLELTGGEKQPLEYEKEMQSFASFPEGFRSRASIYSEQAGKGHRLTH